MYMYRHDDTINLALLVLYIAKSNVSCAVRVGGYMRPDGSWFGPPQHAIS